MFNNTGLIIIPDPIPNNPAAIPAAMQEKGSLMSMGVVYRISDAVK